MPLMTRPPAHAAPEVLSSVLCQDAVFPATDICACRAARSTIDLPSRQNTGLIYACVATSSTSTITSDVVVDHTTALPGMLSHVAGGIRLLHPAVDSGVMQPSYYHQADIGDAAYRSATNNHADLVHMGMSSDGHSELNGDGLCMISALPLH